MKSEVWDYGLVISLNFVLFFIFIVCLHVNSFLGVLDFIDDWPYIYIFFQYKKSRVKNFVTFIFEACLKFTEEIKLSTSKNY